MIQVPANLAANYQSVHDYYNATKHSNRPELQELLSELGSEAGLTMAARYFEYVRRILEWYYSKNNVDIIPVLAEIDYVNYDIQI